MKTLIFLVVITSLLLSTGCHREAAIPNDSFRLTVQRVITDSDVIVSLLKIHVPHNAGISVDGENFHSMVPLAFSPEDAARDGQVALSASRIERLGEKFADVQTLVRVEGNGISVGGPAVRSIPAGTKLESYFSVSSASGDYKLDTPVEIARLDGKPVMLVVGKPSK